MESFLINNSIGLILWTALAACVLLLNPLQKLSVCWEARAVAIGKLLTTLRRLICRHEFGSPQLFYWHREPTIIKICAKCGAARHGHAIIRRTRDFAVS